MDLFHFLEEFFHTTASEFQKVVWNRIYEEKSERSDALYALIDDLEAQYVETHPDCRNVITGTVENVDI